MQRCSESDPKQWKWFELINHIKMIMAYFTPFSKNVDTTG